MSLCASHRNVVVARTRACGRHACRYHRSCPRPPFHKEELQEAAKQPSAHNRLAHRRRAARCCSRLPEKLGSPSPLGEGSVSDAYDGTPSTDRNLYVDSATIDGTPIAGSSLTLFAGGPESFTFQVPVTTAAVSPSTTASPLVQAASSSTDSLSFIGGSNTSHVTSTTAGNAVLYQIRRKTPPFMAGI